MQVVLSTRHGEISERESQDIREQCQRLSRYEPRLSRLEVTLSDEKNRWEVEALAHVDRSDSVHAHAEGGDPRTAVDAMIDRMTRQLKRSRERRRDHRGPAKQDRLPDLDAPADPAG